MQAERAQEIARQYCCMELVAAEGMGVIATATGGVWIGGGTSTCLDGFPKANFCPFCGSHIVVDPPNENQQGWDWHAEPHDGSQS